MVWFFLDNYYVAYEAFSSKMYWFNFGTSIEPSRLSCFTPKHYILFEKLFAFLYNFKNEIFWYDIVFLILIFYAYTILFIALKHLNFNFISISTIIFIVFYWVIRFQNFTHVSYLLAFSSCFLSFIILKKQYLSKKIFLACSVGFIISIFLRWETSLVVLIFFLLFSLLNFNAIKQRKIFYFFVTTILSIILIINISMINSKKFYWQIEKQGGEYVILYERAITLSPNATFLDSLKVEMLNNWIIDDSTLIDSEYFKNSVLYAKSSRNIDYYLQKLQYGYNNLKSYILKRIHLLFVIFFLAFISFKKNKFLLLFLLSVFLIIFYLSYENLLSDRHYFSILNGIFIFLFVNNFNNRKLLVINFLLFIVSTLIIFETNRDLIVNRDKHLKNIQAQNKILEYTNDGTLYTDMQYEIISSLKTLSNEHLLNNIVILSLQQFSYSDFFINYHKNLNLESPLNKAKQFESIINKKEKSYLLISESRLKTLTKILSLNDISINFERILELECQNSSLFIDCVSLFKISKGE